MVALARVQERIETDLSAAELQNMIDEVQTEIDSRFGPLTAITVFLDEDRELAGDRRFLRLIRPADTAQTITVVEIDGTTETVLASDDFRVLYNGNTLERLRDGTNGRTFWERVVKVTYTPIFDTKQRDEVIIQVVQLGVTNLGSIKSSRAGDSDTTYNNYMTLRNEFINSLVPGRGLLMV